MGRTVKATEPPDRRRGHRRRPADLPWLKALRLRPGLDVVLIDLSAGGALVETPTRLRPGARTVLELTGLSRRWTVSGAVSRCWVAALESERGVVYRAAVVFDDALDWPRTRAAVDGSGEGVSSVGQPLPMANLERPRPNRR